MANTIARQVILNGSRNYVLRVTIIGDGSGEETALRLNSTTGDLGTNPKIISIQGALSGFSARLLWDATTDEYCLQVPSDNPVDWCFDKFGGLINTQPSGVTGDLVITTSGLGNGDSGVLFIAFSKS